MRKKPKGAKTKAVLKRHVRTRALQRFGWDLSREEIDRVIRDIQQGRAIFIDRQSNNVTRYSVTVRDMTVGVVYDKQRKCIRTICPVEYFTGETCPQSNI